MVFLKTTIFIEIQSILMEYIEYDTVTYIYKENESVPTQNYKIEINSLNELFFENIFIFLNKSRAFLSPSKEAYAKLNPRDFIEEGAFIREYPLKNPGNWSIADFYGKTEQVIGKIELKIQVVKMDEAFDVKNPPDYVSKLLGIVFNPDITKTLKEIKRLIGKMVQGDLSCIFKNFIGFMITEFTDLSNPVCSCHDISDENGDENTNDNNEDTANSNENSNENRNVNLNSVIDQPACKKVENTFLSKKLGNVIKKMESLYKNKDKTILSSTSTPLTIKNPNLVKSTDLDQKEVQKLIAEDMGCFTKDCVKGYGEITLEQAKQSLKTAKYALSAYLDSKLMKMLVKNKNEDFNHIKDPKLRFALNRCETITESNFIKYSDGENDNIGFTFFFDDQNTLIVSFRGTLTHREMLCDFDCGYQSFMNGFTHSGILKVTNNFIKNEMESILELMKARQSKQLMLTGHSLGGAIATILYIVLKNDSRFSNFLIKAEIFSVPPIISRELFCHINKKDFITYNFGNDLISRLSFGAILDLKYICISIANELEINLNTFKKDGIKKLSKKIKKIRRHVVDLDLFPKLYHGGQIIHIKKVSNCFIFKQVDPVFFADLTNFKNITSDHVISRQIESFEYLMRLSESSK
jgi:hypothetical protein